MGDLFNGYGSTLQHGAGRRGAIPWDEMFQEPDPSAQVGVRSPYRELYSALSEMTQDELRGRADAKLEPIEKPGGVKAG